MTFLSRRQKIALVVLYLLLTLARLPTLIAEGIWFNAGFLVGQAIALTVIVWAFGRIYGAVTSSSD